MNGVIDLNADIGESYGLMRSGQDELISPHVTSVNIATGFHSGDPDSIKNTVNLALKNNNSIGAHPSYPDLQGFGRRYMEMSKFSIENIMTYQIGALYAFAPNEISHIKPHGALYNAAAKDIKIVEPIFNSIVNFIPSLREVLADHPNDFANFTFRSFLLIPFGILKFFLIFKFKSKYLIRYFA